MSKKRRAVYRIVTSDGDVWVVGIRRGNVGCHKDAMGWYCLTHISSGSLLAWAVHVTRAAHALRALAACDLPMVTRDGWSALPADERAYHKARIQVAQEVLYLL